VLPLLEKIIAAKKPSSGLPGSLLDGYRSLAEAAGFVVEPIEKGLLLSGKTVKLALCVEFGSRWDFFNTITLLRETEADIKVLITSSNSRSMPMETAYTVLKKKLAEKVRWILLDIEGKKEPMFINFGARDLGAAHSKNIGDAPPRTSRMRGRQGSRQERGPESGQEGTIGEWQPPALHRKVDSQGRELHKTKNYGLQPVDAPPRRKKIYGKPRSRKK
jgi:hypothetical protein